MSDGFRTTAAIDANPTVTVYGVFASDPDKARQRARNRLRGVAKPGRVAETKYRGDNNGNYYETTHEDTEPR